MARCIGLLGALWLTTEIFQAIVASNAPRTAAANTASHAARTLFTKVGSGRSVGSVEVHLEAGIAQRERQHREHPALARVTREVSLAGGDRCVRLPEGELLAGHLGATNLAPVFPGHSIDRDDFKGFV